MEFLGQAGGMIPALCSGCGPAPPLAPPGGTGGRNSSWLFSHRRLFRNISHKPFGRFYQGVSKTIASCSGARFLPPGCRTMTLMTVTEHLNGLFCGSLPTTAPSGLVPRGQTQAANGTCCWDLLSVLTGSGLRLEISDRFLVCTA